MNLQCVVFRLSLIHILNMDKLKMILAESEEIFLRQRKDVDRDEWALGKTAWSAPHPVL